MPLKFSSTDREDIEKVVYTWIELLSEEKYLEAFELTLHDPYYGWTPKLLEEVINGYGLAHEAGEEVFKVTPPETAIAENGHHMIYRDIEFFETPKERGRGLDKSVAIGYLWYDLPLNGHWSDLSVTFAILQYSNYFILELNEVHVF